MQSVRKGLAPRRSMKERDANCESRAVFRKQFFKTELCRFYQSGCVKGDSCCFAHGEADLQTAPDLTKTSLCQAWIEHRCPLKPGECQFAHGWGDLSVTQAFVEYGARQSKKAGRAQSAAAGDAAAASGSSDAPQPRPADASRGSGRPARCQTHAARPSESARDGMSQPPSGARQGSDRSTAETAAGLPIGLPLAPAEEPQPNAQDARAVGPAFQVAVVLQPWGLMHELPLLPLQLAPVGIAQPGPAQQLPDNHALEMLLRQAMPDHYDD